jgi:hypothetical protein
VHGQGQIDYWKAEVIRERTIFIKLKCAILDGSFHIEYLSFGSWNVVCCNIMETV